MKGTCRLEGKEEPESSLQKEKKKKREPKGSLGLVITGHRTVRAEMVIKPKSHERCRSEGRYLMANYTLRRQ